MKATAWMGTIAAASALTLGCGGSSTSDGSSSGGESASGGSSNQGGATATGGAGESNITVGEGCDPLEPCGGDIEGTWTYEGACIDWEQLGVDPTDLEALCPDATWETTGSVTGTVTFNDGAVVRDATVSTVTNITIPGECVTSLAGDSVPVAVACPLIGTYLDEYLPGAVCSVDGTDCNCTGTYTADDWDAASYMLDDGTLTLDNGRTFDYCTDGSALRYQETGDSAEPGIYDLSQQ
jgi:hypothetical protein